MWEVTLNSLRGKSPEERHAAIGRFPRRCRSAARIDRLDPCIFRSAAPRDISSPDDSLRVVHFENSVNAINTLA
ncbi:MAG: hypothetical protein ACLUNS_00120 [Alistipes shahii]